MKWRETELSPKPHPFSLFRNTAENPFLLPPATCGLRVLPQRRELLFSPQHYPAPCEFSSGAWLFPGEVSTQITLCWSCRVNTSPLQNKLVEGRQHLYWVRAGPGCCSDQREPAAAQPPGTGCRMGFRRSELSGFLPTEWMFTGSWEQVGGQAFCPRPLELGSSSQLPSGCHLVTPGCPQHSSSISGKGGSCLA